MIYINGDSHSAGAELIPKMWFAHDDPKYTAYGRRPHPEAVKLTYGYKVAAQLNQGFFCDAESAGSNDRIMRTFRKFLNETKNKKDVFVIIGWATFEREEWLHPNGEDYIQVTASGTDSVPDEFHNRYRDWVITQTDTELDIKTKLWHNKIYALHLELRELGIKHLFFNTHLYFDSLPESDKKDWHGQFIEPYDENYTYYYWLQNAGFATVTPESYQYGVDAQTAWSTVVLEYCRKQFSSLQGGIGNASKGLNKQVIQQKVDKPKKL